MYLLHSIAADGHPLWNAVRVLQWGFLQLAEQHADTAALTQRLLTYDPSPWPAQLLSQHARPLWRPCRVTAGAVLATALRDEDHC